jgi:hypothetical protein
MIDAGLLKQVFLFFLCIQQKLKLIGKKNHAGVRKESKEHGLAADFSRRFAETADNLPVAAMNTVESARSYSRKRGRDEITYVGIYLHKIKRKTNKCLYFAKNNHFCVPMTVPPCPKTSVRLNTNNPNVLKIRVVFTLMLLLFAAGVNVHSTQNLSGPVPYGIEKRPKPRGADFSKLLPASIGPYKRNSFIAPKGGEHGSVIYQQGSTKIYMQFGRSISQEDVQQNFRLIVSGATSNGRVKPRILVTGKDPSYVKIVDEQSSFFGWTRGLYHFTVDTKLEKDMDAFMTLFPY